MTHAVLRRARAGDEGPRRLRPQGHRPRPGAGRRALRRRHRARRREPVATRCARSARSTTASPSPASASTTSSTSSASPASAPPTSRATSTRRDDVDARSLANQYAQILGQIFTHEMKPMEVEILVAEVGHDDRRRPAVPHPLRRHRHGRAALQRARRRRRGHRRPPRTSRTPTTCTLAAAVTAGHGGSGGPDRTLGADDLEVAVLLAIERPALLPAVDRRRRRRDPRLSESQMARAVDLNSDVGEGFGAWPGGPDEELMPIITSANVACGFHAGDPSIMRRTCEMAVEQRCAIGAQVSYPDLAGFGRRFIDMRARRAAPTRCSTSSARSTAFARVAGSRSATSSRTARCTTPSSATSSKPTRWPRQCRCTTRRCRCSGLPGTDSAIERAAAEHGLTFVPRASPIVATPPRARWSRAASRARC